MLKMLDHKKDLLFVSLVKITFPQQYCKNQKFGRIIKSALAAKTLVQVKSLNLLKHVSS